MASPPVAGPQKYPKTPHLPFSPGVCSDDVVLSVSQCASLPVLAGTTEAVITEKLDGGNCSIYHGKVYARTISSEATHASFGPIKQLAAEISYIIPRNIQLFGENMFGIHSIEYDNLKAFFYVFAALENGDRWLAWDHVTELTNEIGLPTVPVVAKQKFSSLDSVEAIMTRAMQGTSACGSCNPEGFVIRTMEGFSCTSLDKHVAKYVRPGHVQTEDSWKRTWKQARLH